jgi:hypothetical protein
MIFFRPSLVGSSFPRRWESRKAGSISQVKSQLKSSDMRFATEPSFSRSCVKAELVLTCFCLVRNTSVVLIKARSLVGSFFSRRLVLPAKAGIQKAGS